MPIPTPAAIDEKRIPHTKGETLSDKVVFSFEAIEKNDYFNLDATCENWSAELFEILKIVSGISKKDIIAGRYSNPGSTLRIHNHQNATAPCPLPRNVSLKDMWQIRISKSKGGIHGVFYENIFYLIWFDPQHNLYPDDKYGGIKVIKPPMTCCKDRDIVIQQLTDECEKYKKDISDWEQLAKEYGF